MPVEIEIHIINHKKIAEVISGGIVIKTTEDGLDLVGNLYYQIFDKIITILKTLQLNLIFG